jgi:hypothetical protein
MQQLSLIYIIIAIIRFMLTTVCIFSRLKIRGTPLEEQKMAKTKKKATKPTSLGSDFAKAMREVNKLIAKQQKGGAR